MTWRASGSTKVGNQRKREAIHRMVHPCVGDSPVPIPAPLVRFQRRNGQVSFAGMTWLKFQDDRIVEG